MMVSLSEDDKLLRTRAELMAQLATTLGGRVAEEIMFGEITTGAENDLEKVNQLAQAMVLKFGMSDQFAARAFMMEERLTVHSDDLSRRIDQEIDAIVAEAKLMAQDVLLAHRDQLERMTEVLIERETIDRPEFELLMADPAATLPPLDAEDEAVEPVPVEASGEVLDLLGAKEQREAAAAHAAQVGADSVRPRDENEDEAAGIGARWHRDALHGRRHLRDLGGAEAPAELGTPLEGEDADAGDDGIVAA
jgi:hypothetical protein